MQMAALDKLIWLLIFGGMLLFTLGLFLQQGGSEWGWSVAVAGGLADALGVLLIFVRSRRS